MRNRQRSTFTTVTAEGALLPTDLLQRIALFDPDLGGINAEDYHRDGEKLNEAINDSWLHVLRSWQAFQSARTRLPQSDAGTTVTRERWLLALFSELGYGRLFSAKPLEIADKSYPISHAWQHLPIHLVSYKLDLDQPTRSASTSGYRFSPHSLVQELLNRSPDHLWGMVSNGLRLRLLRKNVSLTRQAYVEFDLEAMMQGESYADFVLFWLLCHQSRVESERPADCWLEKWSRLAHDQGIRALDQLRNGVEQAINNLGSGFLSYPSKANHVLREKLRNGELQPQDYYRQVLRFVYRMIILFVAEDRDLLFHPDADEAARTRYTDYYSTARLRHLAQQRIGTRHADLFHTLWLVMEQLGSDTGYSGLGLPALNGFLFSHQAIPDLVDCALANHELLEAVRSLAFTYDGNIRRSVDYKNLGSEELGSIYESLLELHPDLNIESASFSLTTASGNERKTSGSYYTPTSLIDCLLDSALEPVLAEACAKPDPEKAILALKVCDPACGSGHFLIAAAHRIARRLAGVRTGTEESGPIDRRAALRDVVGHCIYGVDINPMSVELCKVNLWMEAIEPGKPLSFLDAHIQCGNSLLGTTPALLNNGIPDSAFEPIEGDDKKVCSGYKKINKQLRVGQSSWLTLNSQPWDRLGDLASSMMQLEEMDDDTVEAIHLKQARYEQLVTSSNYENGRMWADAWCAAFVWKKTVDSGEPITDEVFRKIEQNPRNILPWMKDEIMRLSQQYQFFHWHLTFPDVFRVPTKNEQAENEQMGWSGGFDVVLGNPPWERIKIQEKEWFATRKPEIANAAKASLRREMIVKLQYDDPPLYMAFMEDQRKATGESHIVRDSGRYPLCGRGDVNTYTIFAENMRCVISPMGRVGCIVPSGIATDDTTKFFFSDLMETHSLASLFSFENEAKLFPGIDHRVKFALLTLTGLAGVAQTSDFVYGAYLTDDLKDSERHFTLTASDISLLNPNTRTCPIFRSKRDMEITKAIYNRMPVLIKEGPPEENPWSIKFSTMFHMTNDSYLFRNREQLEKEGWKLSGNIFRKEEAQYLPLFEAKMVWHFNHRFGTYEGATYEELARNKLPELSSELLSNPDAVSMANSWVTIDEINKINLGINKWAIGLRGITSVGLLRTLVGTIMPGVATGNSLILLMSSQTNNSKALCLQSNISSFVEDYVVRQKVGGVNLNFFIIKQIPLLAPTIYLEHCEWSQSSILIDWIFPRALELTYTAWDLEPFAKDCGYNGPPFRWDEERRFLLRCELDAAYFILYGIARDDVDYIMGTFRVWKEKEEKQLGEYRTKRVILEIYDELQKAIESGEPYQTRLDPPPADAAVAHAARGEVEV